MLTAPSGDKEESETEPLSPEIHNERSRNTHLKIQPFQTEIRVNIHY